MTWGIRDMIPKVPTSPILVQNSPCSIRVELIHRRPCERGIIRHSKLISAHHSQTHRLGTLYQQTEAISNENLAFPLALSFKKPKLPQAQNDLGAFVKWYFCRPK